MKKLYILLLGIMISVPSSAQLIKNLDEVSNFKEGLASVRRGDQWAFIDQQGSMVIDFRDDLVSPH